ncbi:MAG TPA: H-X9-DG-CTERM domain-containing protein, partial [Roseimicrobium sp.]|nr:H-X9-DG-CTERM domain-containing protein [Roseimicrobium sp.]
FAFIHFSDSKQLMWDNLIGSYLKSNRRGANASVPATMGSQLLCPADTIAPLPFAVKYGFKRRSYAMPWHTMDPKNWPPDKNNSTGVGLWWATYGGSNSLIRTLNTYTNEIPSIRRDMILSPSMTMLVTEQARSNNIANNTTGARIRYTADHLDTAVIPTESFHRGKFNYLMVDGSAMTLHPEGSVGRTGATGDDPKTHKGMWSIRSDD